MATPKVISFRWDNAKGDSHNGSSLVIGQHLPNLQNSEITHIETYGISISTADTSKDYQLKRYSNYVGNLSSEVKTITKEEAREALIAEIDKQLDILFNETEMQSVQDKLNIYYQIDEDEDED